METINSDIAIVGGGPAALASAHTLQSAGRRVVVLEKGCLAAHVARFPTFLKFFSTPDLLELAGFPLIITQEKPTREEYLNYLRRFVREMKLDVRMGHEILGMEEANGAFRLTGRDRTDQVFEVRAEKVILATGAYDTPQRLGVPGEDLPKVSHYFEEVHSYFGSKVLIVGGKNSAVETAMELWRAGVHDVSICHRDVKFGSLKYWLEPDIENRIKNGEIKAYRPYRIVEITPKSVRLQSGRLPVQEIENDFVLAMTGYRPNPDFLARFGISTDPENGRPVHDPTTLESERPGVYMVGVMLAGNVSGEIFIENSRTHGEQILAHLSNGSHRGPS